MFSKSSRFFSATLFTLLLTSQIWIPVQAAKKDRNQPHPHQGMLTPYQPNSFDKVSLTKKEEEILAQGKPVMKQSLPNGAKSKEGEAQSGGALCIQDVDAPVEAVWYQILDFNDYKSKVPNIKTCQNYAVSEQKSGKNKVVNIKTRMILSALPGFAFESFYDHMYFPDKSSLTWTLDYDKTSDFDDVAGHWHVQSLRGPKSRVFYACDIQMSGPMPAPLLNYIGKAALKKATAWVKRESEAHPDLKNKFTPQTTSKEALLASSSSTKSRGGAIFASSEGQSEKEPNNNAVSRIAKFFNPKLAFLPKM
ncbi:hypothetical protein ACA910_020917 [Epithemia clementina (nom. ined.)]